MEQNSRGLFCHEELDQSESDSDNYQDTAHSSGMSQPGNRSNEMEASTSNSGANRPGTQMNDNESNTSESSDSEEEDSDPDYENDTDLSESSDSEEGDSDENNESNLGDNTKESALFKCYYCSKAFKNIKSLYFHTKGHMSGLSDVVHDDHHRYVVFKSYFGTKLMEWYSCDYCDKIFSHLCKLKHHTYVHVDVKVFKCNMCAERFNSRYRLAVHKKKHLK